MDFAYVGRLLIISKSVETLIYYTCVGCNFHSINSVNLCFKSIVEYLLSKLQLPSVCAYTYTHMHTHTHSLHALWIHIHTRTPHSLCVLAIQRLIYIFVTIFILLPSIYHFYILTRHKLLWYFGGKNYKLPRERIWIMLLIFTVLFRHFPWTECPSMCFHIIVGIHLLFHVQMLFNYIWVYFSP